ncbi:MAG: hypothetical protein HC784_02370 [Hydrococcus sp. CSU_1_8]|nr:hypothetical protein [Hydrococcus sp. CSU_1_8]
MTVSMAFKINSASNFGALKEKFFSCTSFQPHFLENNYHFTLLVSLTEKYWYEVR